MILVRSLLALLLVLIPVSAVAQPTGPGAMFAGTSTSTAVSNSTLATNVASISIPAGFVSGPNAIHFQGWGNLSTAAAPGTYTLSCAYGYSAAAPLTLTIANALPLSPSLSSAPVKIDCYVYGNGASGATFNNQGIYGEFIVPNTGAYTAGTYALHAAGRTAASGGNADTTQSQTMNVQWTFGSALSGNAFTLEHYVVTVGN